MIIFSATLQTHLTDGKYTLSFIASYSLSGSQAGGMVM